MAKRRIRNTNGSDGSFITLRAGGVLAFNAKFCRDRGIRPNYKVKIEVNDNNQTIHFSFISPEINNEDYDFTLVKDGGGKKGLSCVVTAKSLYNDVDWLKKFMKNDDDAIERQFIPYLRDNETVINIMPNFENYTNEIKNVPDEVSGIYKLKDGNEVVYIGRGQIKNRIADHKNKSEYKFDQVLYSVVNDEEKEKTAERFWIEKYKEDKGVLPKYNKQAGG